MEVFVKIEICLLHSDFVYHMEKFFETFLQKSSYHTYKILHASGKNCKKCHMQLTKKIKISMQARLEYMAFLMWYTV